MSSQELKDALVDAAKGPRAVAQDDTRVEQHSLDDLVKAKREIDATEGTRRPHRGLGFTKLNQPGATS